MDEPRTPGITFSGRNTRHVDRRSDSCTQRVGKGAVSARFIAARLQKEGHFLF